MAPLLENSTTTINPKLIQNYKFSNQHQQQTYVVLLTFLPHVLVLILLLCCCFSAKCIPIEKRVRLFSFGQTVRERMDAISVSNTDDNHSSGNHGQRDRRNVQVNLNSITERNSLEKSAENRYQPVNTSNNGNRQSGRRPSLFQLPNLSDLHVSRRRTNSETPINDFTSLRVDEIFFTSPRLERFLNRRRSNITISSKNSIENAVNGSNNRIMITADNLPVSCQTAFLTQRSSTRTTNSKNFDWLPGGNHSSSSSKNNSRRNLMALPINTLTTLNIVQSNANAKLNGDDDRKRSKSSLVRLNEKYDHDAVLETQILQRMCPQMKMEILRKYQRRHSLHTIENK